MALRIIQVAARAAECSSASEQFVVIDQVVDLIDIELVAVVVIVWFTTSGMTMEPFSVEVVESDNRAAQAVGPQVEIDLHIDIDVDLVVDGVFDLVFDVVVDLVVDIVVDVRLIELVIDLVVDLVRLTLFPLSFLLSLRCRWRSLSFSLLESSD